MLPRLRSKNPLDVLLVNPPASAGTVVDRQGASGLGAILTQRHARPLPPLALVQVAANARAVGLSVGALDLTRSPARRLESVLGRVGVVVGVLVSQKTLTMDLDFIRSLRARLGVEKVLPFGISTWFHADELRGPNGQGVVLVGEPENKFGRAALYLAGRASAPPPGLLLTSDQPRGHLEDLLVENLDDLPTPAWELLGRRWKTLSIYASRGCDDRSRACPHSVAQGAQLRGRSAVSVIAEIRSLERRLGTRHFVFLDPAFATDPDRTLELCRMLQARRSRSTWSCSSRPEHLPADLIGCMADAGCREIRIELESLDPQLLHHFGRIEDVRDVDFFRERVEIFVKTALRLGIHPQVTVVDGLPGQIHGDVDATARFARALGVRRIRYSHHAHYAALHQSNGTSTL